MKYNHAFELGFTVISSEEDPEQVPIGEILFGLLKRLRDLEQNPGDVREACQCYDTCEEE